MNWYHNLRKFCYRLASNIAIFLVKRKLKKNQSDLGKWILLAKLYEAREEKVEAIKTLKLAQRIFPKSELLKNHLSRLQKAKSASTP